VYLGLTGQLGLRQRCHADQIPADQPVKVGLGPRRELGPLHHYHHPAVMYRRPHLGGRLHHHSAQLRAIGLGEGYVGY